jgi:hypothetical protein
LTNNKFNESMSMKDRTQIKELLFHKNSLDLSSLGKLLKYNEAKGEVWISLDSQKITSEFNLGAEYELGTITIYLQLIRGAECWSITSYYLGVLFFSLL